MSSSSNSTPCAACKSMRRRCTQDCIFAPYFPSHDLQKFEDVHRIYGANRVSRILSGIDPNLRESAVNSLCFEAKERCRDPIYGCVGRISSLQERLRQVQRNIDTAKIELASYIGPSAFLPVSNDDPNNNAIGQQERVGSHFQMMQHNNDPAMMSGVPLGPEHNNTNNDATSHHQQQILAQFVALREQEMSRSFGLLHVQENGGLVDGDNQTVSHHHRMNNSNSDQIREMQPSVHGIENRLHLNHRHQLQQQIDSSGNYIHNQQLLSAHDEQQQIDNAGYVYGQQQLFSDHEQHQRPHSQMQQIPTSNVTEEFKRI